MAKQTDDYNSGLSGIPGTGPRSRAGYAEFIRRQRQRALQGRPDSPFTSWLGVALGIPIVIGICMLSASYREPTRPAVAPPAGTPTFNYPAAMRRRFGPTVNEEKYQWYPIDKQEIDRACNGRLACRNSFSEIADKNYRYLRCDYHDDENGNRLISYRAWYMTIPDHLTEDMHSKLGGVAIEKCPPDATAAARFFHRGERLYDMVEMIMP